MTATQLGRICRSEPGHSPMSLVNDHLIREAQRDLVYSGMTIKQIAPARLSGTPRVPLEPLAHTGATPT